MVAVSADGSHFLSKRGPIAKIASDAVQPTGAVRTGVISSPILLSQPPSTCSPVSVPLRPQKAQVRLAFPLAFKVACDATCAGALVYVPARAGRRRARAARARAGTAARVDGEPRERTERADHADGVEDVPCQVWVARSRHVDAPFRVEADAGTRRRLVGPARHHVEVAVGHGEDFARLSALLMREGVH